jgi:hypothetical protein
MVVNATIRKQTRTNIAQRRLTTAGKRTDGSAAKSTREPDETSHLLTGRDGAWFEYALHEGSCFVSLHKLMNTSKSVISKLIVGALIMITLVFAVATVVLAKPKPTPPPPVMCCVNGKVVAEPNITACQQAGGLGLFGGNIHVGDPCGVPQPCWCCVKGKKILKTTPEICWSQGGHCYNTQQQAEKACNPKHQ